MRPPRSAMQHRNVVMNILHYIDSSGKNYSKLFSRKDLNSWTSNYEARGRKPGTIKTNLGSLKHFYKFILITQPIDLKIETAKITQMTEIVSQWCKNYYKKIQIAKHHKQLADLANLPAAEEIRLLDQCDLKKEAIKTLSLLSVGNSIASRKCYCLVRDYLLTYIVLDNASRAGCISNMTLGEFNASEVQPDASFIITVKNHKTAATAGPAMLSVTEIIMRHLRLFVAKVRNRLPGITINDKAPVFASWSGKMMATSMISTQLNKFWKAGINTDMERRITTTLLRKMAATTVHEHAPELRQSVADLMNHDIKTAKKEYFLIEKKKSVAATGAKLRELIRTDFTTPKVSVDLTAIFEKEIEAGAIKIADVRDKMEQHPELQKWDALKLRDKVTT